MTEINFFNIVITEPATVITDLILTVVCLFFYLLLKKKSNKDCRWYLFFLFLGMATFAGAASHGLKKLIDAQVIYAVWVLMQVIASLAIFAAEQSSFKKNVLKKLSVAKLFICLAMVIFGDDFLITVANSALGLLLVLAVQVRHAMVFKKASGFFISLGILSAVPVALVFIMKIGLNEWFTHNDLAHLLMVLCLWLIFIGAGKNAKAQSQQPVLSV